MHDIWNPWHGCRKHSAGCANCYMMHLDKLHRQDGTIYRKSASGFDYPLRKDRQGKWKLKPGEMIRVCMMSDFFWSAADGDRQEAWQIMNIRKDLIFFLLTKRPEQVKDRLPANWDKGWENIFFHVTMENQETAEERIPLLLSLPFRHKGIMCAPLIGPVNLTKALASGQIEQVIAGGENYENPRPCRHEWVVSLYEQCKAFDVKFTFIETGSRYIKDGRLYTMPDKTIQSQMAYKSGLRWPGKPASFFLKNEYGPIPEEKRHVPYWNTRCQTCGSKPICNGCSKCGKCT